MGNENDSMASQRSARKLASALPGRVPRRVADLEVEGSDVDRQDDVLQNAKRSNQQRRL